MAGLVINNLSDMRAKVIDWGDRADLSDSLVNDFINIACQRVNKELLVPPLEVSTTLTFSSEGVLTLPSSYLSSKTLTVTSNSRVYKLERKEAGFVEEYASCSTGVPKYFARKGNTLIVAPTPSGVTEAVLDYYQEVASVSGDSDTNVLLTEGKINMAVLYAALKELHVYVSDEEAAASWQAQYMQAVMSALASYDQEEWSGDTLSVTP